MSTVLVVDDEQGIRESLNILLTSDGHEVVLVENGQLALEYLKNATVDVVLTDIRMPEINGLTLLKTIRNEWKNQIPVIILTAYGAIPSAVDAVKEGAADFITKPFDIERLKTAVAEAVNTRNQALNQTVKDQGQENHFLKIMNQKLDRAVFELAILHEIGKIINSTLELKKIVSIILEMTRQAVNADRARLVLFKPDSKDIDMDLSYAVDENVARRYSILDNYAMEWVLKKDEALLIEDITELSYFKTLPGSHNGLRSFMVVPFKRKNHTVGAILLAKFTINDKFYPEDFRFVKTLANQVAIAIENAQLYSELQLHFGETIRALITAIETKDAYTYGHSDRVTEYSTLIGQALGLDYPDIRKLEYLALLHDVGKVGVDGQILRKTGKLDFKEWEAIKDHPKLGSMIIKPIKFLEDEGARTIRHHHEWYNGHGYPDGLKGDAIPIFSRIIAIADAFDAMTSLRPYRSSVEVEEALKELKRCAGEQFDPALVDLFCNSYMKKPTAEFKN